MKGDSNLDYCIDLLLKHFNLLQEVFLDLLCLALVKKYPKITIDLIDNELTNHPDIQSKVIFRNIVQKSLLNLECYNNYYKYIYNIDFMYNFDLNPILSYNEIAKDSSRHQTRVEINEMFYEGFSLPNNVK